MKIDVCHFTSMMIGLGAAAVGFYSCLYLNEINGGSNEISIMTLIVAFTALWGIEKFNNHLSKSFIFEQSWQETDHPAIAKPTEKN